MMKKPKKNKRVVISNEKFLNALVELNNLRDEQQEAEEADLWQDLVNKQPRSGKFTLAYAEAFEKLFAVKLAKHLQREIITELEEELELLLETQGSEPSYDLLEILETLRQAYEIAKVQPKPFPLIGDKQLNKAAEAKAVEAVHNPDLSEYDAGIAELSRMLKLEFDQLTQAAQDEYMENAKKQLVNGLQALIANGGESVEMDAEEHINFSIAALKAACIENPQALMDETVEKVAKLLSDPYRERYIEAYNEAMAEQGTTLLSDERALQLMEELLGKTEKKHYKGEGVAGMQLMQNVPLEAMPKQPPTIHRTPTTDSYSAAALERTYLSDKANTEVDLPNCVEGLQAVQEPFLAKFPVEGNLAKAEVGASAQVFFYMRSANAGSLEALAADNVEFDVVKTLATWKKETATVYSLQWKELRDGDLQHHFTDLTFDEDGQKLQISRIGEFALQITFREGQKLRGIYDTPYGEIHLLTLSNKVEVSMSEPTGGCACLEYALYNGQQLSNYVKIDMLYDNSKSSLEERIAKL